MDLELFRVIIDFGLVVLIWMIQLIVYPSFKLYTREDLIAWHKIYTTRIATIVIPLMFAQLIIYGIALVGNVGTFELLGGLFVVSLWLITFIRFVPLHNAINSQNFSEGTLQKLVSRNWERTLLWNLLFLISLVEYMN